MEEIIKDDAQREKVVESKSPEAVEQASEETDEKTEMTTDQEMSQMQRELAEADDMMLRLAAEMDNYKKRTVRERELLIKYAAQGIMMELLPVLDNFERALDAASKSRDLDSFLEGVGMIYKQMYEALERKGITRINCVGEAFDPNVHEAVMQVASEEHSENVVVQECQKGYMLHDRVIRPSMVAVSKGSEEE